MSVSFEFLIVLFIVAFLYSSVGHGGASGYLALMAIANISPSIMKPTALLLNLLVSSIAFGQFYSGNHFKWKIWTPFALFSIPLSYLGGSIHLHSEVYKKLLGLLLIFPIIRLFFFKNIPEANLKESNLILSLFIGAILGFISGMIGIGGGILLSPILLLLGWTNQKQTAAVCSLFILVNSIAGLAGQWSQGIQISSEIIFLSIFATLGGFLGSYLGSKKLNQVILKNILGLVLALAAYKLLFS